MKIDNDDTNEVIEEMHRICKFQKDFNIGDVSECEYNDDSNSNKEESSYEKDNEIEQILLVFSYLLQEYNSKENYLL